jgi:glycerol-3-phosphate dehydrogenase (NAD(P)+)
LRFDRYGIVIVALPSHVIAEVLSSAEISDKPCSTAFISCAKGLADDCRFASEVIYEGTGSSFIGVISGASFADEMLAGRRVYLTLACSNIALGRDLIKLLENVRLRIELTDDVRGLEIAGVGKNIIALGAGIADGLRLGENFRASFIAKGVTELRRIVEHLGGRSETLVTGGALADFFLTCSSYKSRNYAYGVRLAQGADPSPALAEGRQSAAAFLVLLDRHHMQSNYFHAISTALSDPPRISTSLDE